MSWFTLKVEVFNGVSKIKNPSLLAVFFSEENVTHGRNWGDGEREIIRSLAKHLQV